MHLDLIIDHNIINLNYLAIIKYQNFIVKTNKL